MKHILYSYLLLLTPLAANAMMGGNSFFFEPSVGYRNELIKLTNKANVESQMKMMTPTYGLKLGYRSPTGIDLNLAGDYSSGKTEWGPLTENNNFSHKMAAVQLGVNAMGAMKIYLGYAFMNELKVEAGLLNSDILLKGPAYQAGIAFNLFSNVAASAQYNLNQFDEISGTSYTASDKVQHYFNKLDSVDYSFSLSLTF
ncbi:MAG: hypothetical protein H7061_07760 [Bdellovibrionaceae bacterium]|nr:hypothetical protein [Bdellovibrio sp.]